MIITEIKCTVNVMHLNRPNTLPLPWSVETLSSTKPRPDAKKAEDCCSTEHWKTSTQISLMRTERQNS